jgi:hypothetical protein
MAALRTWWRTHLYIVAIAVAFHAPPSFDQPRREILNSERIAAMFGSYGIEVLEQDDAVRVSNLYSETDGERTCRTFAVVRYGRIDSELRTAHAAIVAGGSIGAVLTAAGWEVRKTHLHYGTVGATPKLASLMKVAAGTGLSAHVYALDVSQAGRTLEYAALVEIHHPGYLGSDDLLEIYGPADEAARPGLVATMLAAAEAAAQR